MKAKEKKGTDLLDSRQVADILRIEPRTVSALIREGKFPNAARPGRGWLVPRSDVHEYIKETHK